MAYIGQPHSLPTAGGTALRRNLPMIDSRLEGNWITPQWVNFFDKKYRTNQFLRHIAVARKEPCS